MASTAQEMGQHAAEVRISHLSKRFGDLYAVRNVSLHIQKGDFYTFLGPSGCGKTTNARKLEAHFKADTVIDGESSDRPPQPGERTLILTNHTIPSAIEALSLDRQADAQKFDSVRFISFNTAMQELN